MAILHTYRYSDWFNKYTVDIDDLTAVGEVATGIKSDLPAGMTGGSVRYKRAEVRPRAFATNTDLWFFKVRTSDRLLQLRATSAGQWDISLRVGLARAGNEGLVFPYLLSSYQFASSLSPGSGTSRTLVATDILTHSNLTREADRGLPLWQMVNLAKTAAGDLAYGRDPHEEWVVFAKMNGASSTLPGWLRLELIYVSEAA